MAYGLYGEWFDFDGDSAEEREMHDAKEELKSAQGIFASAKIKGRHPSNRSV